jgi:hypothetical protein
MFDYIMSHESMYYDLISSGSGLWDQGKQDLFESGIHRGQRDFMNHPVTRGAIDAVAFVVGGGIEGVAALANLGKSLFSKTIAKTGTQARKNVFTVTKEGVALPKGAKIPNEFVQNPYRNSNYGVFENGKFVEKLRIDQATPPGFKGPNQSHFHLDNGSHIFDASKWLWWW